MRDEQASLSRKRILQDILEDCLANMRIKGGEGILNTTVSTKASLGEKATHIEYLNVRVTVDCTTDVEALLLTTRERDTLLADFRHVTIGQHVKIGFEAGIANSLPVPLLLERSAEADVLPDCRVLHTRARVSQLPAEEDV